MATNNHKISNLTAKEIYEEIGRNYRFFLNWRYALIVGYLICLGTMGKVALQLWTQDQFVFLALALVIMFAITKFFYELERRNRDLYRFCTEQGKAIENKFGIDGVYTKLQGDAKNDRPRSKYFHSSTIDWFFTFWFVLLLIFSISFGIYLFNYICRI